MTWAEWAYEWGVLLFTVALVYYALVAFTLIILRLSGESDENK